MHRICALESQFIRSAVSRDIAKHAGHAINDVKGMVGNINISPFANILNTGVYHTD